MPDYERDIATRKKRARHSGRRDPHMFVAITRDLHVEFWYGIHGPNGEHRRFAMPPDEAYVFLKRQTVKLERMFQKLGREPPPVDLSDVDDYVNEAVKGVPDDDVIV